MRIFFLLQILEGKLTSNKKGYLKKHVPKHSLENIY